MKTKWLLPSLLAFCLQTPGLMVVMSHAAPQGPAPAEYGQDAWDRPPYEFTEIQQRGFRDGVDGAGKDFDNHRAPNVENRKEYRHPHVDPSARDDYREGFRRGYDAAMRHLDAH